MWDKRTPRERADVFIWVGEEALYIWDKRHDKETKIPLDIGQNIPYVPNFHLIWENPSHYQAELRKALGRRKCRVFLAVPDDTTFIERTALEDFVYAAAGRRLKRKYGLTTCSHSASLGKSKSTYIATTRTCRCYCVALVKNGAVVNSQLLDAHRCERSALEWEIRAFCTAMGKDDLKIYYPETEEDWTLMGLGKNVSFSRIATLDKPKKS